MPASANKMIVFIPVTLFAKIDRAFPSQQSSICTLLMKKEKLTLR